MNLFEFSANFPDVISAKAAWKTFRDRRGVTCKKYNSKKRYWLQNISQYQRTATVTVAPNGTNNTAGSISTVTATIKTDCLDASGNNILESITQTLTRPGFSSFANSPTGACSNGYQNWTLSPVATVAYTTNWQWTVDNPQTLNCSFSSPNSQNTNAYVSGGGGVTVTYTDQCGYKHSTGTTIYANCSKTSARTINLFPNPSSSVVKVNFGTTAITASAAATSISADLHVIPESVELYTQTSSIAIAVRTKKQIVQDNNQAIFNLKGLIPGYYFVHVVYTDGIEIRTVQVI